MAVAIIGLVVGLISSGVGMAQKQKAMQIAQEDAAKQRGQNVLLSQSTDFDKQIMGVRGDVTSIINETIRDKLAAEAQVQAAAATKQGDVLMMVGSGVILLSLGVLVFRKHKA